MKFIGKKFQIEEKLAVTISIKLRYSLEDIFKLHRMLKDHVKDLDFTSNWVVLKIEVASDTEFDRCKFYSKSNRKSVKMNFGQNASTSKNVMFPSREFCIKEGSPCNQFDKGCTHARSVLLQFMIYCFIFSANTVPSRQTPL